MRALTYVKAISGAVGLSFGAATGLHAQIVETDLSALTRATSGLVGIADPSGNLVRSTDGGTSFSSVSFTKLDTLLNVAASGDTVIAVGNNGYIARSTDGGAAWANVHTPTGLVGELRDAVANGATWVAVGGLNSNLAIFYSTNSGQSWLAATVPTLSGQLTGVTFDSSTGRWTAVGTDGIFTARILTSTNGSSWSSVTAPVGASPLTDVAADGAGNVLAVGEAGTLLISADGGASFALDSNSGLVSENLNVVVYSSTAGWVAGGVDLTRVGYTTGGGATLIQAPAPGTGDIRALAVAASGEVLYGGNAVTEVEDFNYWRAQNFTEGELADANISGPQAVAAADGINNLLKYAFGLPAKTNTVLPTALAADGSVYAFTFSHPSSVVGVSFAVEVSTDLQSWSANGVTMENLGTTDGRVQWRATYPTAGNERVFFRLKATLE